MFCAEPMVSVRVKHRERRKCVKVEVAVLGSPSLIVLRGFCGRTATLKDVRNGEQIFITAYFKSQSCAASQRGLPRKCADCVSVS